MCSALYLLYSNNNFRSNLPSSIRDTVQAAVANEVYSTHTGSKVQLLSVQRHRYLYKLNVQTLFIAFLDYCAECERYKLTA